VRVNTLSKRNDSKDSEKKKFQNDDSKQFEGTSERNSDEESRRKRHCGDHPGSYFRFFCNSQFWFEINQI
jgi:hypothetical protein